MKIRNGFVSNSSSCSFTIHNLTNKEKTLVNFVKENAKLLNNYIKWYNLDEKRFTHENMIKCAKDRNVKFHPNQAKICIFGDEDGDVLGEVYDYQLRDGGKSKSFKWKLKEMLR